FFGRYKTGDLMARATNDMNAIRNATGMATVAFVDGAFMTLAILVILFTQYPAIALMTILPFPILTVLVLSVGRFLGERFRRVQEGFASLAGHVQETISGIRVVKAFVKEDYFSATFDDVNNDYRSRNMSLVRIFGFFYPAMTFLSGLTIMILLWLGGVAVIRGSLNTGDFVAYMSYLEMLAWPMMGAGYTVNMLQRGAASLKRVNAILDEIPEISGPSSGSRTLGDGSIAIRRLSYSYLSDGPMELTGVDLEIPRGTTLGILGRTGSGKTTLIRMLPRLLDPPKGTLFIGGTDLHEIDLEFLRSSIGMVPQDSFLFSDTIRENIAFGAPAASEELIQRVADISTITRDLETFPRGMDTLVGERGVTLSGGQKQRIAISRALAVDPEILILDESLSAVDTETEEKILAGMKAVRSGKTTIIISHRVSTLANADHIVVIDEGRIIESGGYEELIAADGLFSEIHALQQLERGTGGQGVGP
ncbi:MAG TPA: ABC transporter ATP-binding protein, partial [Spirochaetia bacterium]|nr:ABC transporter ATP-binding protein [Spirochaetia bacterium]